MRHWYAALSMDSPCAWRLSTCSTAMRVPAMLGRPERRSGLRTMPGATMVSSAILPPLRSTPQPYTYSTADGGFIVAELARRQVDSTRDVPVPGSPPATLMLRLIGRSPPAKIGARDGIWKVTLANSCVRKQQELAKRS